MQESDWHDHPTFWKYASDERKYTALAECKEPFCCWTALTLSAILFSPILWFCYECITK